MLYLLISIIGIFVTIFFVIGTHEAAHFAAARWLGIKVLRFSIGFGKVLFRYTDKKGTEYVLALIPLGGYVKMLDENEGEVPPQELPQAFNRQPLYKKFIVVMAGPACNLFCAFVLYWLVFVIGFTTIKPIIGEVTPNSIAAQSGLKPNQEIISLDNNKTLGWTNIVFRLIVHTGNQDQLRMQVEDLQTHQIQEHQLDLTHWQLNELNPDPLASLGIVPYQPNIPMVIGIIQPDSPAATSDLKVGDKIIAINQRSVKNWDELITFVAQSPDQSMTVTIERNKKILTLPIHIGYKSDLFFQKTGYLGIAPKFEWPKTLLREIKYSPIAAIPRAAQEIYDFTYFNLLLFGKMITGKISLQSLGGPITIFESAGSALNYGFLSFISFLAFLSISIGVINLLPIPGLDGGHLVLYIIEAIIRRPLPEKVITILFKLGFLLLFFILIQAFVNDILRL